MKSGQKHKLILLLEMLGGFFTEPDEKTKITIRLKSGKNNYKAEITPSSVKSGTYSFKGPGKNKDVTNAEIISLIADEVSLYDEAEMLFINNKISKKIVVNDKNVTIKDNIVSNSKEKADFSMSGGPYMTDDNIYNGVSSSRDYFIKINEAEKLLNTIGIIGENGKILNDKIRKYNQIDRFIEFADPILRNFIAKKEKITVLDLACGKSYLSFVLYYYITEKLGANCEITGLDIMENVISSSNEMAKSLGYKNMRFVTANLAEYEHKGNRPSLCISLHACDTATDYALFTAIKSASKAILCVPCCHSELLNKNFSIPELAETVFKHNAIREKFSALFTESLRILLLESCGYKVSLTEYISPLDSPKNLLIKALIRDTGKNIITGNTPDNRNIKNIDMNTNVRNKSYREYLNLKSMYGCEITLGNLLEKEGLIR